MTSSTLVLLEGWLKQKNNEVFRDVYVVLTSEILSIYSTHSNYRTKPNSPVRTIVITAHHNVLPNFVQNSYSFSLFVKGEKSADRLYLKAANAEDFDMWLKQLEELVKRCKEAQDAPLQDTKAKKDDASVKYQIKASSYQAKKLSNSTDKTVIDNTESVATKMSVKERPQNITPEQNQQITKLETEVNQMKKDWSKAKKDSQLQHEEITKQSVEIQKLKKENETLKNFIDEVNKEKSGVTEERDSLKKELSQITQIKNKIKSELNTKSMSFEKEKESMEKELEKLRQQSKSQNHKESSLKLQTEIDNLTQLLKKLKMEHAIELREIKCANNLLEKENKSLQKDSKSSTDTIGSFEKILSDIKVSQQQNFELTKDQLSVQNNKKDLDKLNENCTKLRTLLDSLLKNQQKDSEMKEILAEVRTHNTEIKKIHGLLINRDKKSDEDSSKLKSIENCYKEVNKKFEMLNQESKEQQQPVPQNTEKLEELKREVQDLTKSCKESQNKYNIEKSKCEKQSEKLRLMTEKLDKLVNENQRINKDQIETLKSLNVLMEKDAFFKKTIADQKEIIEKIDGLTEDALSKISQYLIESPSFNHQMTDSYLNILSLIPQNHTTFNTILHQLLHQLLYETPIETNDHRNTNLYALLSQSPCYLSGNTISTFLQELLSHLVLKVIEEQQRKKHYKASEQFELPQGVVNLVQAVVTSSSSSMVSKKKETDLIPKFSHTSIQTLVYEISLIIYHQYYCADEVLHSDKSIKNGADSTIKRLSNATENKEVNAALISTEQSITNIFISNLINTIKEDLKKKEEVKSEEKKESRKIDSYLASKYQEAKKEIAQKNSEINDLKMALKSFSEKLNEYENDNIISNSQDNIDLVSVFSVIDKLLCGSCQELTLKQLKSIPIDLMTTIESEIMQLNQLLGSMNSSIKIKAKSQSSMRELAEKSNEVQKIFNVLRGQLGNLLNFQSGSMEQNGNEILSNSDAN